MSTYVMSDIHGEAEKFQAMLEKIEFSEKDYLYIIGDVIDRGPEGIGILLTIMDKPNILMLLGNHEYMMMQYYAPEATEVEIFRWNRNGNEPTMEAFAKLDIDTQNRLMDFLKERPTHIELEVGSRRFYLVHGFPGENTHDEVWTRPAPNSENPIAGTTLIIGHTPVLSMITSGDERDRYKGSLAMRGEHPMILHEQGFIDIDCGCSYEGSIKTLGCLRLDDMMEFYV